MKTLAGNCVLIVALNSTSASSSFSLTIDFFSRFRGDSDRAGDKEREKTALPSIEAAAKEEEGKKNEEK